MNSSALEEFKSRLFIANGAILLLLAVVISIPNGMLLLVLYKDPLKSFRNATAVLVTSLAITDFLTGFVTAVDVGLAHILEGLDHSRRGDILKQAKLVSQVTVRSSVLIIVLFAVERFLAVVFPFFYHFSVTATKMTVCCVLCWVVALTTSLVELVMDPYLYDVIFLYAIFVAPLLTVSVTYSIAYFVLKTRAKQRSQRTSNHNCRNLKTVSMSSPREKNISRRSAQMDKELMKTASLILLVYVVSLLPFWSFTILGRYCEHCANQKWFIACYRLSIPVLYSNSGLNPLLYAWRMRQYRASFQTVFQRKRKRTDTEMTKL